METYKGLVRTTADCIILFEACRLGILPRVQRRLSEKERASITSGCCFVFDEREAGMRRWTDGKSWSASRVSGSFLTYREMEGKRGGGGAAARLGQTPEKGSDSDAEMGEGYRYKQDGLLKQSFSIQTREGHHLHLISYYSRNSAQTQHLMTPSADPALRHIRPPKGMYPESTVSEQHSTPPVTRSPLPGHANTFMPPGGYPQHPHAPNGHYAQPGYPQWQGPPATSAPNGYQPYPPGAPMVHPHGAPPPGTHPHAGAVYAIHPHAGPPPPGAHPGMQPDGLPRPMGHHRSGSGGSAYRPGYGSARPSPRSGPASLAPPGHPGSRHHSNTNTPAGTPPMPQADPALAGGPFAGGHLPPVRAVTRTPSPANAIPSIGSLMNGANDPRQTRSASNSPGHRRLDVGPADIPSEKIGFNEDMRALRVLDRAFKT